METPRKPAAELLKDLADHACVLASAILDMPMDDAEQFGEALAAYMADTWGGQVIYMPQDAAGRASERNAQIYAEFRGDNHAELAKQWGLSVQHIHRIIARERKKKEIKQAALPLD